MTARRDGHFWTLLTIGLGVALIGAAWVLEVGSALQSERSGGRQGVHTPGSPHGSNWVEGPQ